MQRSLRLLGSAVALRVLAFVYFSSRPQLGYLFESRGVAAEDVSECVFLLSRGFDPYAMGCRVPPAWLLLFRAAQSMGVPISVAILLLNILADLLVVLLWRRRRCKRNRTCSQQEGQEQRTDNYDLTCLLLLFNPVHIIATALPTLQPLNTLLLLLLLFSLGEGKLVGVGGAAFALLGISNGQNLALTAPVLVAAAQHQNQNAQRLLSFLLGLVATAAALCFVLTAGLPSNAWLSATTLGAFYTPVQSPHPGVLWYLQTEVFTQFREYFSFMMAIHPFFYMLPLTVRFWGAPVLAAEIMAALLLIFSHAPAFGDIWLVFYLLASHPEVLQFMRHKEFVAVFALVPLALLPIIQVQWMEIGNANANYYFFAGLSVTFSAALGIVEFSSAAVKWQKSLRSPKKQEDAAPSSKVLLAAAAADKQDSPGIDANR